MNIDWSKAPEGATHYATGGDPCWFKVTAGNVMCWSSNRLCWRNAWCNDIDTLRSRRTVTPRPTVTKSYTRDEALQFLVEHLDEWPTDIADAPLCNGWGWKLMHGRPWFYSGEGRIVKDAWFDARTAPTETATAPDMVNHPPHYQSDNGVECIDAIRAALGHEGFIAYCTGNAMKYLWRHKSDRLEDMRKASWYLDRAIEEQSNERP